MTTIVLMAQNDHEPTAMRTTRRTLLTASAAAAAAAPLVTATAADAAPSHVTAAPGRPIRPQRPSAELRALLRQVDRRRIEATVRRLAAFGTRHTLSSQD